MSGRAFVGDLRAEVEAFQESRRLEAEIPDSSQTRESMHPEKAPRNMADGTAAGPLSVRRLPAHAFVHGAWRHH